MIPAIPAKSIVSAYYKEGWFASNYTMNIYRGCSHGCIYCDSRSECYRVAEFDTVHQKENTLALIERDLKSKRKKGCVITGSMSDPYNPAEAELQLTRSALKLIDRYGFGIAVDTKSPLPTRDADLFCAIAAHSPVSVNFTVTTFDDGLCTKVEPYVAPSSERFKAIEYLAGKGIPCGILLMPILPYINDQAENIRNIVRRGWECGVSHIYPGFSVTLRQNQRAYFLDRLDENFPGLRARYAHKYGYSYECIPENAEELWQVFTEECDALGILYDMAKINRKLKAPYMKQQLSWL